jgi:hypothetical protein
MTDFDPEDIIDETGEESDEEEEEGIGENSEEEL